jgi:hypothetical protein
MIAFIIKKLIHYNQKKHFKNKIVSPCRVSDFVCLIIAILTQQKKFKSYTGHLAVLVRFIWSDFM